MKNKISKLKGFTLVELLIVIALIAILSVAVLATINPIEQSNKARDAAQKNDAAEVLSAYERYYTSQNKYPWQLINSEIGSSVPTDESVVLASTDARFGILGVEAGDNLTTSYANNGVLVVTSELKSSFRGKAPFQEGVATEDILYVYSNATDNSNYVCFHPKANANRTGDNANKLKCVDQANNIVLNQNDTCVIPAVWTYAISATSANVVCVPDGEVN